MTAAINVKQATIDVAGIQLTAFQLPEGHYKLSLSQLADALGLQATQLRRSTALQNLPVQRLKLRVGRRSVPLQAVLLGTDEIASALLMFAAKNEKVAALLIALVKETFERRCDAAFGCVKTELTYEQGTREFFRELARREFHSKLTLQMVGCFHQSQWGREINAFKKACGLPLVKIDEYDRQQVETWYDGIVRYNCFRMEGATHKQALVKIHRQRIDREVAAQ